MYKEAGSDLSLMAEDLTMYAQLRRVQATLCLTLPRRVIVFVEGEMASLRRRITTFPPWGRFVFYHGGKDEAK